MLSFPTNPRVEVGDGLEAVCSKALLRTKFNNLPLQECTSALRHSRVEILTLAANIGLHRLEGKKNPPLRLKGLEFVSMFYQSIDTTFVTKTYSST